MIRSMTGFGAASGESDGLAVRVEIRSVNHRHFQVKTRLPSEFMHLEIGVEELIKKKISRGFLSVNVGLERTDSAEKVDVDLAVAKRYLELLRRLAQELEVEGELTMSDVVQLPGILGSSEGPRPTDKEGRFLLKTVSRALEELVAMRSSEGTSMETDLQKNAKSVARIVERIEKRMPRVIKSHQQSLERRVNELVGKQGPVSSADLAREVALLADRMDVSEEVTRLRSHCSQLDEMLAKGGTIGRKLDFLVQEFFREANTIGAKCNDAQVSHSVVDLKTTIERLREQVQNVE